MVATVGSISIDLSTNAAKFASGFKSAATTVESQSARMAKSVAAVERGVTSIGGTLKTFVGGLAAGAGIASIASLSGAFDTLKQTISEYDEIATNSRQVGLKPETFQALSFAAKQANVEQETFNTSLTIFAKNAGLAEKGTGALFAGLKKLNPQLLQNIINTKDQEERLKLVSDALAQTNDATQKAALAATVFGKSGVEMARFLDQGRSSIEAMKKSARDMGIIVPDELLQRAGELDDKLDVLSKIIHVQLGEAVINLAPVLEKATIGFANFSKSVNTASGALTDFVNDPSWATLEKLIVSIGGEPFKENSLLGHLANGTMDFGTSAEDISAITKGIDFLKQKIAELQDQAAKGADVHIELTEAQQSLNDLELRLRQIQGVGVSAANEIRASFAEAFRAAENASMDALASMRGAAAPGSLPNVTRYRGDPNKIELPDQSRNVQTNVNGSGVSVTKYNSDTADNTKDTASYTRDTADNIDTLDRNTNGYFRDLGSTVTSGAAAISHSVSSLADLIGNEFGQLPSYLIAALQSQGGALNTGSISQPSNMFGPNWDPQHGSYVGEVINLGKLGSYHMPSTASDGSSNNQVSVAQPGSNYTLQYYAAPGDSLETTKQKARAAFEEMVRAAASA
ncbi:hypothetical protein EOA32_29250 [Mesorhizobium sp. M1A.F.Ca.ET.072.01.1.1]|uniref:hypothetical protein n=1 Tax=Mesorhizobium sp. M1A.F.Ca.ET.072.01.1.1 TaxID=2496753 RepID=UPI000FD2F51C|nr:hypothetical protein [Mesorhizobium sp. M1A.F.Ca.ET.072.01.1.1]RUW47293.1 hypothetical protein EOA32_29250 [Mesorhizobium sp. M1A.F.Ca.ET.072.01.1.1]TIV04342.1 MAG: hypothetical protein E5W04_03945 [Mesorhizobium sp.]